MFTYPRFLSVFLASFLILFLEMVLIRWVPTQVRVVGYFPNLILISAFLGIGLGALSKKISKRAYLLGAFLLILSISSSILGRYIIYNNNANEFLWLLYNDLPDDAPKINGIYFPLMGIFIASFLCFIPLGNKLAEGLNFFRAENKTLSGYCWDIAGSLLGVVVFSVISFYGIFPNYWFLIAAIFALILFIPEVKKLSFIMLVIVFLGIFLIVSRSERAEIYSPYYALKIKEYGKGFWSILANGSSHQVFQTMKLSANNQKFEEFDIQRKVMRMGYHRPYKYLKIPLKNVLIVGAGNGNDVAVALENGAENIDAIEIDQEIIKIGKRMHPDKPYDSSKVKIINNDARSYINSTNKKYDLVVFATLDSMTKLSALSNVRLDNFIYTEECLRSVKRVLKDNGGLIMNFSVHDPKIRIKLMGILAQNFDDIYKIEHDYVMFNVAYLAGKAFSNIQITEDDMRQVNSKKVIENLYSLTLPNDNWPYLYLNSKSISSFYLQVISSILLITILSIYGTARYSGMSNSQVVKPDWEMYLLGMAFLLFEGQAVITMNLLWGTTWITSAVVFGSILLMILLSTLFTNKFKLNWKYSFYGLFVSLILVYLVPLNSLLYLELSSKLMISLIITGLPVFFAGICFAQAFATRNNADHAFAWNLFGAVCGGLVEFMSMITGFKILILIALMIYMSAYLIRTKQLDLK